MPLSYLPSLEPDTRMKAGVIKHSRIHKRHGQIWHSRQFNHTINLLTKEIFPKLNTLSLKLFVTYVAVYFRRDSCARFVNDSIHLFNDIEISLVIRILHSRPSPWNIGQLPRR